MLLINKFLAFIKSLFLHIYNGSPKSNQNLINKRFSICLECDSYDSKNKQCLQCGCNINQEKILLNKLAWADQKCPLNKW